MTQRSDQRYEEAVAQYGDALVRLACAYEADADRRRDLLQEIHVALWRSMAGFDARCSLRTWVYRVGHNVAASHVAKERRVRRPAASIEDLERLPASDDLHSAIEEQDALNRVRNLIRQLKPPDGQIVALYLDGLSAQSIADVVGLSPGAVATRVSRVKILLTQMFQEATHDG